MTKTDLENVSRDLQRLAFNLADEIDTLNFHTMREAVSDMRRGVQRITAEMHEKVRSVVKRVETVSEHFPNLAADEVMDEFTRMEELLDIVRKCTGEPKNYRDFIQAMPELIELCDKWGAQNPLGVEEPL